MPHVDDGTKFFKGMTWTCCIIVSMKCSHQHVTQGWIMDMESSGHSKESFLRGDMGLLEQLLTDNASRRRLISYSIPYWMLQG